MPPSPTTSSRLFEIRHVHHGARARGRLQDSLRLQRFGALGDELGVGLEQQRHHAALVNARDGAGENRVGSGHLERPWCRQVGDREAA